MYLESQGQSYFVQKQRPITNILADMVALKVNLNYELDL